MKFLAVEGLIDLGCDLSSADIMQIMPQPEKSLRRFMIGLVVATQGPANHEAGACLLSLVTIKAHAPSVQPPSLLMPYEGLMPMPCQTCLPICR